MYVCMYVCIDVYIYIHIYTYIYTYANTYIWYTNYHQEHMFIPNSADLATKITLSPYWMADLNSPAQPAKPQETFRSHFEVVSTVETDRNCNRFWAFVRRGRHKIGCIWVICLAFHEVIVACDPRISHWHIGWWFGIFNLFFPTDWVSNHPNWLSDFSEGGLTHQRMILHDPPSIPKSQG